jgi:pyruvate/2-oxoglutarate dehydrogenase complex dihydrolipoamide acyltransferase (E2) component
VVAIDVKLPQYGMTMHEATVVRWLRNVGERVEEGEPIALLETDKATVELEAPQTGVLAAIEAEAGDTVAVTERLAVIEEDTPMRAAGGAP